ncbi:hypothetical protein PC9H_003658 [Pleurotus ostreatus]|uniref:Uncharacterized protein n=2 Tax=Pleurotus TaxID=5320 RepID=A0A8H6ZYT0_PLEOS|nr:uncharacterized protein PC9H_003658 [Pleurotus ostreatus]KAF7436825.1 hypothetical protein PC9H_003658 [Pleurotus ostreatus]KAG9222817.1 hypothetical protein CCMSSC00406_0000494 [Pleurotus cornucopiae]
MADFVQNLDPSKLVLGGTALSFLLSPFAAPPYNLPIFLFGIYAQENTEGVQSLQTFTALLGISHFFDVLWMMNNEQQGFVKFMTVVLLLLKIPVFFAFGLTLRQRGAQFSGLGIRGGDLSGATVWSGAMPGGLGNGYQSLDEESVDARPAPKVGANPPPGPPPTGPFQV